MNRYLWLTGAVLALWGGGGCKGTSTGDAPGTAATAAADTAAAVKKTAALEDWVPKGYVVFSKVYGDLDKDGKEDCAVVIKGTDKDKWEQDEVRGGKVDRNRRGILVLLKRGDGYELVCENRDCFSSENEDGGVYYPPELSVEVSKGNLYINYAHGRYGFWGYTFRLAGDDMELIGFDNSDNHGPVVNRVTSINFLTGKRIDKVNTNESAEGGDEVYQETKGTVSTAERKKLSQISDFDELDVMGEQG